MNRLKDEQGRQKSITISYVKDWMWAPTRNLLMYTTMPPEDDDNLQNVSPQIGFTRIPQRDVIGRTALIDSTKLEMYVHPLGKYLAVRNTYTPKKHELTQIELFDLTKD